ncbi:glycosyltransferase domain-containing protein [Bacillus thuringiensis]|uniref:glycosyltransferase domain-containing protein n=1 Tax=Bacillus thuringiensis TaxID=1428 RepID=UPI0036712432
MTNRYDRLKEIPYLLDYVDYIAFTDDKNISSKTWNVLPIDDYQGDPIRTVKQYKILAHKFLKNYKYSIWIDGSFEMKKDIQPLINYSSLMTTVKHPSRKCIYKEMDVCSFYKKDAADKIQKQKERYLSLGYPINYGLIASGFLFREHNHPEVIAVMEDWWNEVKNHSKRDQLSFNYSAWKNNFISQFLEWDELIHYFSIHPHVF